MPQVASIEPIVRTTDYGAHMAIRRAFFNVVCADVAAASRFYIDHLGFKVRFSSTWFMHVAAPDNDLLEVGFLQRDHALVPAECRAAPAGAILTIVVDDVDALFASLTAAGVPVVEPPTDQVYGQRRMLVRDPAGTLIDISSECAPDPAWLAKVTQAEDGSHVER